MSLTNFPHGIEAHPIVGAGLDMFASGNVWFVDGTNGSDGQDGTSPSTAVATIQAAVNKASAGGVIYVRPKLTVTGATDPTGYTEAVTIANTKPNLSLIGISTGRAMGGQPMLRQGAGTDAHVIVRAPGVTIKNFTINGSSNTGGGIYIDESASAYVAFGTTIEDCYFKNCKGSGNASTGGAIYWSSNGGGWQTLIRGCYFHNNRCGIALLGTSSSMPEAVTIRDCEFVSNANTTVDADIYISAGSGMQSVVIRDCFFGTVDIPAYASSPAAARYIHATSCEGLIANCYFACVTDPSQTEKTFGAAGDAAVIPTTMRIAGCYGECVVSGSTQLAVVART